MDLLFSKYASPFIFIEQMLNLNRLSEFVTQFLKINNENKLWELYLAAVSNPFAETGSFEEWKEKSTVKPVAKKVQLEAAVKNSRNILQDFNPEGSEAI